MRFLQGKCIRIGGASTQFGLVSSVLTWRGFWDPGHVRNFVVVNQAQQMKIIRNYIFAHHTNQINYCMKWALENFGGIQ